MKSDKANVCTLASALKNSQPLSALTRLHFKIPNRVTALMRLHLKIANQELGSPTVSTFASEEKRYTISSLKNKSSGNWINIYETSHWSFQKILSKVKRNQRCIFATQPIRNVQFTNLIQGIWVLRWIRSSSTLTNLHPYEYRLAQHPVVEGFVQRIHERRRYKINSKQVKLRFYNCLL